MSQIEIKTVTGKKGIEKFVEFRNELYKDSPIDIPYLFMDEVNTLTKGKNPSLDFCDAEYYMAYRDGKPVGRIAAIINSRANEKWNAKSVRFGFFDFVDDKEVSAALINKVKEFGRQRGMDTIVGPLGFTDMDREGMLVEGFTHNASLHANHNFPYYKEHIEAMGGFEKDNDWVQYSIRIPEEVPERLAKVSKIVEHRCNVHARKMSRKQLLEGGFGQRFFEVLNVCYQDLYNFSELDSRQIDKYVKEYIALADLNLVTILCDDNDGGKMVGFGVSFPSFFEAMKKTKNGKLFPFGWFHLLRLLKFHNTKTVDLLLIAVLPEYRAKGVNAMIFNDLIPWYNKYGFEEAFTLAMMETNDKVLTLWQYFDTEEVKRLRCFKASI